MQLEKQLASIQVAICVASKALQDSGFACLAADHELFV
jgi:hypothetical protein